MRSQKKYITLAFKLSLIATTSLPSLAMASWQSRLQANAAAIISHHGVVASEESIQRVISSPKGAVMDTVMKIKQEHDDTMDFVRFVQQKIEEESNEKINNVQDFIRYLAEKKEREGDAPQNKDRYDPRVVDAEIELKDVRQNIANLENKGGDNVASLADLINQVETLTAALRVANGQQEEAASVFKKRFIPYSQPHVYPDHLKVIGADNVETKQLLKRFKTMLKNFYTRNYGPAGGVILRNKLPGLLSNGATDNTLMQRAQAITGIILGNINVAQQAKIDMVSLKQIMDLAPTILTKKEEVAKMEEQKSYATRQKTIDDIIKGNSAVGWSQDDFNEVAEDFYYTGDRIKSIKATIDTIIQIDSDIPGVASKKEIKETFSGLLHALYSGSIEDTQKYLSFVSDKRTQQKRSDLLQKVFVVRKKDKEWQEFTNEMRNSFNSFQDNALDNQTNDALKSVLRHNFFLPRFIKAKANIGDQNLDLINDVNTKKFFQTLISEDVLDFEEVPMQLFLTTYKNASVYMQKVSETDEEKVIKTNLSELYHTFSQVYRSCVRLDEVNAYIVDYHQ